MTFNPVGFRTLDEDETRFLVGKGVIRANARFSFILIKPSGLVTYAKTVADKDILIKTYAPLDDLLLMVWGGEYRTDTFVITKKELDLYYYKHKE